MFRYMRYKDNGKFNRVYGKTLLGAHLIHGQSLLAETQLISRNPANPGDRVGVFPLAGRTELEKARQSAEQARAVWQKTPPAERRELLWQLVLLLEMQQEPLAHLITREWGLVWPQSRAQIYTLIAQLKQLYSQEWPEPVDLSDGQPPEGVAVWGAHQGPTASASFFDLLQVLFQGPPLIWLAWQEAPAVAYTLASLCQQAGLPPGVLNFLIGGQVLFLALQEELERGQFLDLNRLLKVTEHSFQPQIVLRETPLDQAVSTALEGLSQYQRGCLWPVLVQASVEEAFTRRLLRQLQNYRLGDPSLDHRVKMGPLRHQTAMEMFLQHLPIGKAQGGQLLSGKGRLSRENKPDNFVGDPDAGYYVWPAVWQQLTPEMTWVFQPVYGPSLGLFRVADRAQAQAWSRNLSARWRDHTAFALS